MTDIADTIAAKSDQLNSDDLMSGPITITVTAVNVAMAEQPVAISYQGDNGKPYKPGKSMRRVLVALWGNDSKNYVGRKMTLYRDPKVKFGGMEVGGIRISHMSHITDSVTMALTATKGSKKAFTVKPLVENKPALVETAPAPVVFNRDALLADAQAAADKGTDALKKWWSEAGGEKQKVLAADLPALKERAAKITVAATVDFDADENIAV